MSMVLIIKDKRVFCEPLNGIFSSHSCHQIKRWQKQLLSIN